MCTVVVSFDPTARVPVKLLGVRDELVNRPWRPPARHWPGSPLTSPLIGGIDEQAGGTWLAVHPGIPRVACLLNARGPVADPARRRSRGELPLRAAAEGPGVLSELAGDFAALAAYDPFLLIAATPDAVTCLTWRGARPEVRGLAPGTHMFTNAGHAYPADPAHPDDPRGEPKAEHFAAKFAAARPSADPARGIADAWGDWLTLAAGDSLDPSDPGAIIARRHLPEGGLWGSTSVTLVGLGADGLRYDFQARPGIASQENDSQGNAGQENAGQENAGQGNESRGNDGWYSVPLALSPHCAALGPLWCRYAKGHDHRHSRGLRSGRGPGGGRRSAGSSSAGGRSRPVRAPGGGHRRASPRRATGHRPGPRPGPRR
jgi:hypothetical protein